MLSFCITDNNEILFNILPLLTSLAQENTQSEAGMVHIIATRVDWDSSNECEGSSNTSTLGLISIALH